MGAPLDLADPEGVVFEPGRPYLVRLMESVRLPEDAVGAPIRAAPPGGSMSSPA